MDFSAVGRSRTQSVDDQAAARRADEMALFDAGGDQPGIDVRRLDPDVVVAPVAVIGREAAAAIVEDDDLAWPLFPSREKERQLMEIARIARKAWQADDRYRVDDPLAIDAGMELQSVGGGIVEIREFGGHESPGSLTAA